MSTLLHKKLTDGQLQSLWRPAKRNWFDRLLTFAAYACFALCGVIAIWWAASAHMATN